MKPVIFCVHGMGNHSEGSFKAEVVDALNAALSYYPNPDTTNIESDFDIIVFSYNDIFEKYLTDLKDQFGDIVAAAKSFPDLQEINKVVDFQNDFDSLDKKILFTTHWLDVALYRYTMLGEAVRARFNSQLSQLIRSRGSSNIHIVSHSLGTAVTLDSLSILYDKDVHIDPTDGKLNPITNRLGSVTYLANVAHVLEGVTDVYKTVVNPSDNGCANRVFNINHKLDPFTHVKPYKPEGDTWAKIDEINEELIHLATEMPHDVANYLKNPIVNKPLFECFFKTFNYGDGFDIANSQFQTNNRLVSISHEVEDAINALKQHDDDKWKRFYVAFKSVYEYIKD